MNAGADHDPGVDLDALLSMAAKAREGAYAPYSGFLVGAALQSTDGSIFTGINVENASYPASICAERTAVTKAVSFGYRTFVAIAVIGSGPGPTYPCGICRQVLFEFAPGLTVLSAGTDGASSVLSLADGLLPHGFGPVRLAADGNAGHPAISD